MFDPDVSHHDQHGFFLPGGPLHDLNPGKSYIMDRLATDGPFSKTDSDDEEVSKPENHDSEHPPKGKETEPILELEQGQAVQTPPNTRFMREVVRDGGLSSREAQFMNHLKTCHVVAEEEELICSQAEGASSCPEQGEMEDPPVDPDMPKLESEDELAPPLMICWAVVKQYRTVMAGRHEWMIRRAECDPRTASAIPFWKAGSDKIVALIAKIEKVVYDDSDASVKMLAPIMTLLSFGEEGVHRDIFLTLGSAVDRTAGSSRDALFRLATDDVALRCLGYLHLVRLLCEEFDVPTKPSSSDVEGRESKG